MFLETFKFKINLETAADTSRYFDLVAINNGFSVPIILEQHSDMTKPKLLAIFDTRRVLFVTERRFSNGFASALDAQQPGSMKLQCEKSHCKRGFLKTYDKPSLFRHKESSVIP